MQVGGGRSIRLGAAYYPEQEPRDRWTQDARLMAEAGISVVRAGEFAWSLLEPGPGSFDFEWLDEALDVFGRAGIDVILGTPTAAPPAWLVDLHPDIRPTRPNGRAHPFGHRRHYCPNNPAFHEATRRVVAALAERYGADGRVIGWQVDNEFGGRCYCESCRASFREWLRTKHGSLDALNERWGTAFWSQTYTSWNQIELPVGEPVPLPRGFLELSPHPGLALDYRRFMSDSYVRYCRLQVEELRKHCVPEQPITHNLRSFFFPEIDYHDLSAELDIVSWDNYPQLGWTRHWSTAGVSADVMRGFKRSRVWVLEQQVGPLGWETVSSPRRGELRLRSYQVIAHGAGVVSYFRWRTARFGTEQHWHGILDTDGLPNRRYRELVEFAREVETLQPLLGQVEIVSDVAVLHDYDSRFALQVQPTNPALDYEKTVQAHYRAVRSLGINVDVVPARSEVSSYRLLVAPSLYVIDPTLARHLRTFVEEGGVLVLAPRVGVKDRNNAVPEQRLPAWISDLAGVVVSDFASRLDGGSVEFGGDLLEQGTFEGWFEELEPTTAHTLARYREGDFAGSPAVTTNRFGTGRTVYIAGASTTTTLSHIYRTLAQETGLAVVDVPEEVELMRLQPQRGDGDLWFMLNHADVEQVVPIDAPRRDHLSETVWEDQVRLQPFGVALLDE